MFKELLKDCNTCAHIPTEWYSVFNGFMGKCERGYHLIQSDEDEAFGHYYDRKAYNNTPIKNCKDYNVSRETYIS